MEQGSVAVTDWCVLNKPFYSTSLALADSAMR
jgi:hypothetical protein